MNASSSMQQVFNTTNPVGSGWRASFSSMPARRTLNSSLLIFWLGFHAVILLGYALLGRGFAYAAIGPIYVGEICLCLGLAWLATFRHWSVLLRSPAILGIFALQVW